jgi:CarD family transcriptional regulator
VALRIGQASFSCIRNRLTIEEDHMEYSVGDKVMYPSRGVGIVTGVEQRELVDGFRQYYVIQIPSGGLTMHVPMEKMDDLGVRPVVSLSRLDLVKERQEGIHEKLRSGRAIQIAEGVRDLSWHEQRAYLTKKDKHQLAEGREFLADEIALATDSEVTDVHEVIEAALAVALASEADQEAPKRQVTARADQSLGAQKGQQGLLDSLRNYAARVLGLSSK